MPDPLQALLAAGMVPTASLPASSRYVGVGQTTYERTPAPGEDPVPLAYFRRRLVPQPDRFSLLYLYAVVSGDRRDQIAYRQLGDPELWWRLADANGTLDPRELTVPAGRRLRITLPESVQGVTDA
jgi:hypothetical protein